MAAYLRIIATIFIIAPFAAMFSEPFFEAIFDAFGWDTEDWAIPAVGFFARIGDFLSDPVTIAGAKYLGALGAGVWLHYLATLRDRSRPSKQERFAELEYRIRNMAVVLEHLHRNWSYHGTPDEAKGSWTAEAAGKYIALFSDLEALDVSIPTFNDACRPKDWNRRVVAVDGLMRILVELSANSKLSEAQDVAHELSAVFLEDFPASG